MEKNKVLLTEKTKDELIDIILGQDKELKSQSERIRELEEKVKEEQKKRTEKYAKGNTKKKRKKRPGRKKGHEGITRKIPENIDEVIDERLNECPDCHKDLGKTVDIEEQIQEDIVPAYVRVRKYRKHIYYCDHCQKEVKAPYHPEHVPKGYLGANVLIQAAILKYYHCLPYRKICELLENMSGL